MLAAKMVHQIPEDALPGASSHRGLPLWTTDGQLVDSSSLTLVRKDVHRWLVITDRASFVAVHHERNTVVAEVVPAAPCEVWVLLDLTQANGAVVVIVRWL